MATGSPFSDRTDQTGRTHARDTFPPFACPQCEYVDNVLTVRGKHWGVCHLHHTCWVLGFHLFSGWESQDPSVTQAHAEIIERYTTVEPFYAPSPETNKEPSR